MGKFFEKIAYARIRFLVPELRNYKPATAEHVRNLAEKEGFSSLWKYYRHLRSSPEGTALLKRNLTLKGSHFFRGNDWPLLAECLAGISGEGDRKVRIWCAGCSSGREIYSVALIMMRLVPPARMEILATDCDPELLEQCRNGSYPRNRLEEIPEEYRNGMEIVRGRFLFHQEIRDRIETKQMDLLTDPYPAGFDVILCRNVMKFFAAEKIVQVQERLVASLVPGGYLFVGNEDGNPKVEMLRDPESMGMRQLGSSCIYRKERSGNGEVENG